MKRILVTQQHDVFWGTHGCRRRRGHANPCRCVCGDWYEGTHVYGDDAKSAVPRVAHPHFKETFLR